jgi:hypothetical protein
MGYGELIAREAEELPAEKQAEVMDFIVFLKQRGTASPGTPVSASAADIEAFFRSFNVDVSGYKFDREDANGR